MILNFHGHTLPGAILQLNGILDKISIDPSLAHWCRYRLQLQCAQFAKKGDAVELAVMDDGRIELGSRLGIGSADSVVLRTALFRLIETLYADWENVIEYLPAKMIDAVIAEIESMVETAKEYPVVIWEFAEQIERQNWVSRTKEKLPSAETLKEFYDLPHMRNRFINTHLSEFSEADDRKAEKSARKALADRNRRLNRVRRGK